MGAIQPLWDVMPATQVSTQQKTSGAEASFLDIFQSAVDAVRETDMQESQMEYLLTTGQLDNPALLTIASSKANSAVDLLLQLRNRAVEAYNEVMRISL